jgi:DNA replication protein DnaC
LRKWFKYEFIQRQVISSRSCARWEVFSASVKSVQTWLSPEDRVLTHLAENTSHLAHEREEMTCLGMNNDLYVTPPMWSCRRSTITEARTVFPDPRAPVLWMNSYLNHFLKSDNHVLAFTGALGSGKTVLASAITEARTVFPDPRAPVNARTWLSLLRKWFKYEFIQGEWERY